MGATQEIARNVQQAAAGTSEVQSSMVRLTEAAAGARTAAEQVLRAGGSLFESAGALRSQVDGFIAEARVS